MLTPNMTPSSSLQLTYLIVRKFPVAQAFQQGALYYHYFFLDQMTFDPNMTLNSRDHFSDLKPFPFDSWVKKASYVPNFIKITRRFSLPHGHVL
jgi:hypothetical protein